MQFNKTTDYALRILLHLYESGQIIPSSELSKELLVPQNYLRKIMRKLTKAGYVSTHQGVNGGYEAREISKISVLEIVKCMGQTTEINYCMSHDNCCDLARDKTCNIRKVYEKIQHGIEKELGNLTFEDLARRNQLDKEKCQAELSK